MMDMDKFKRDYKFKSDESYDDGRRNRWIIIIGIIVMIALAYFLK